MKRGRMQRCRIRGRGLFTQRRAIGIHCAQKALPPTCGILWTRSARSARSAQSAQSAQSGFQIALAGLLAFSLLACAHGKTALHKPAPNHAAGPTGPRPAQSAEAQNHETATKGQRSSNKARHGIQGARAKAGKRPKPPASAVEVERLLSTATCKDLPKVRLLAKQKSLTPALKQALADWLAFASRICRKRTERIRRERRRHWFRRGTFLLDGSLGFGYGFGFQGAFSVDLGLGWKMMQFKIGVTLLEPGYSGAVPEVAPWLSVGFLSISRPRFAMSHSLQLGAHFWEEIIWPWAAINPVELSWRLRKYLWIQVIPVSLYDFGFISLVGINWTFPF